MTDRARKLQLVTDSRIEIEGEGDDLRMKVRAHRKRRAGDYEFFSIDLSVGRWTVQQLARQIAAIKEPETQS
jgi:hypothetical protein